MTLRHVLAIAAALIFLFAVGAVITSAIRRLWDWQAQRNYTPPPLFTEVERRAWETDKPAPEEEFAQVAPEASEVEQGPSMWALTQLVRARQLATGRAVDENLAEFAGKVASAVPVIGCEVEALFELRRLAVNAA